jgi:hypothetical protein
VVQHVAKQHAVSSQCALRCNTHCGSRCYAALGRTALRAAAPCSYALFGHSAGAQCLSRFAAFTHSDAFRIVLANPSTYVWPSREVREYVRRLSEYLRPTAALDP